MWFSDYSCSYTTIKEVENKILVFKCLVIKTNFNAKILDIEKKYFTTSDYNEFTKEILDAKKNVIELVDKSDI